MLCCPDEPVPVLANVIRRAADLSYHLSDVLGRNHFDGVPRANRQLVRIRFLLRDMNANLAADAAFDIDFAPGLSSFDAEITRIHGDAIDRANL